MSRHYLLTSSLFVYLLLLFGFNAQAALTTVTIDDPLTIEIDKFVFSSVSDVTWTQNGNLLGTLISSSGDLNNNGTPDVIEEIVTNSNGRTYGATNLTIEVSDFQIGANAGRASWEGSMAFVDYLNDNSYGGSSSWRLPTVTDERNDGCVFRITNFNTECGYNVAGNGDTFGDEYAELYYDELNGIAFKDTSGLIQPGYGFNDANNVFENEQSYIYWSSTDYAPQLSNAWFFNNPVGYQLNNRKNEKYYYSWAIRSAAPVPEPEMYLMMLVGLGVVAFSSRIKQFGFVKH